MGWLGVAKVSCILRHRGIKLILAYSWAKPATLTAGKDRGGMFFSSIPFLVSPVPLPCAGSGLRIGQTYPLRDVQAV